MEKERYSLRHKGSWHIYREWPDGPREWIAEVYHPDWAEYIVRLLNEGESKGESKGVNHPQGEKLFHG
jgi:hypothetical protein